MTLSSLHITKFSDNVPPFPPPGKVIEGSERVERVPSLSENISQTREQSFANKVHRRMSSSRHHPEIPQVPYPQQRMLRTNSRSQFPTAAAQGGINQGKENKRGDRKNNSCKEVIAEEHPSLEANTLGGPVLQNRNLKHTHRSIKKTHKEVTWAISGTGSSSVQRARHC